MNGLPFTLTDEELVVLAADGDDSAFELIVTRHRHALVRLCAEIVGPSDAEEAVQETLLRALMAIRRGERVRRVGPWLRTIAHNTTLNLLRARATRPLPSEPHAEAIACPDPDRFAQREELRVVVDAVAALPDRQREALIMRELEGRSYDEIGDRLRTTNGAVRQLLARARVAVRARLGVIAGTAPFRTFAGGGPSGAGATPAALAGGCAATVKVCAAALLPATLGSAALTGSAAGPSRSHQPVARVSSVSRPAPAVSGSPTGHVYVTVRVTASDARAASSHAVISFTADPSRRPNQSTSSASSDCPHRQPEQRIHEGGFNSAGHDPSGARRTDQAVSDGSGAAPNAGDRGSTPRGDSATPSAGTAPPPAGTATPGGGASAAPRPAQTDAAPTAATGSGLP